MDVGAPFFADLVGWRKVAVAGGEAEAWLNDLVSADVAGLAPGEARRSLLLSPTGRVQAEFAVSAPEPAAGLGLPQGALLLLQDPGQPHAIDALLARYVLSSDVSLADRTADLALVAVPAPPAGWEPPPVGAGRSAPSVLGRGIDLLVPADRAGPLREALAASLAPASDNALEEWRVAAGRPRLGVDVRDDDLPAEANLMDAVAFDKGCYLGQEAVAKVRNLGHPRRLLRPMEADVPVEPGEAIVAEGAEVGLVTSAVRIPGDRGERWVLLARIRWEAREIPLRTAGGAALKQAGAGSDPTPGGK